MADEELRRLRRNAHATGDVGAILDYIDAALRTVGVQVPTETPTAFGSLTLAAVNGARTPARPGEAILIFDSYSRRVMISADGGAYTPIRMGDDPRPAHVDLLPRFDQQHGVPAGALVVAVDRICTVLCELGYARRSDA